MSEEVVRTASNVVTSENLANFHAEKLGLASDEAPVEAAPVEETVEAEPSVEAEAQSEPAAEEEAKATEERKSNPKIEKRFSELTKRAKQAEAQKAELEARLQELEAKATPAPAPVQEDILGAKPQASQFQDAFEYAEALAEWSAEKAIIERDKQEAERRQQEERARINQAWTQRVEKAKADLPDFEEMVASSTVVVNDAVRDAILESDVGPQILYHLASEDEFAQKIAQMPPIKALREIGKLEARFEAKDAPVESKPEVVAKSKAPAPIKPITASKGTADVLVDTDGAFHGTYAQWKAARQAKRIR
jgi:hypothetical protein